MKLFAILMFAILLFAVTPVAAQDATALPDVTPASVTPEITPEMTIVSDVPDAQPEIEKPIVIEITPPDDVAPEGVHNGIVLAFLATVVAVFGLFGVFIRGVIKTVLDVLPDAFDAMIAAAYASAEKQAMDYADSTSNTLDDALIDHIAAEIRLAFDEAGVKLPAAPPDETENK